MSYPCPYYGCCENHNGECMAEGCRKVTPPSWENNEARDISNGESRN